jgi:oxalate decarboxylase/phosphoglucose isomerase-like protein (cupin superfamily)
VPPTFGHYVENTGNTTMKYLEIFKTDKYEDISLNQWLALTPPEMVKVNFRLIHLLAIRHLKIYTRLTFNLMTRQSRNYKRSSRS